MTPITTDTADAVRAVALAVRQTPRATALEQGDLTYSYAELWNLSAAVAALVQRRPGFRPGTLVGVLLPRGPLAIAAQLGVWRAGGGYLPLDPALPEGRLKTILDDAGPCATLVLPGWEHRVPSGGAVVLADADLRPAVENGAGVGARSEDGAGPVDPAYVVYTSGSTGTPKGVAVGHASLANLLAWHRERYGTGPGTRVAAFAGLGFDATVWEVWSTLTGGATLVLPEPSLLTSDVLAVRDFLDEGRIDHTFLATPLAEQFLALPRVPASLRLLTTGGDRLRVRPPENFPAAVHNHYGPTEATVVTTAGDDLRTCAGTGLPDIGRPVTGARVLLRDADGQPVSDPGAPGELMIGGDVLALGYWRDVSLTSRGFPRDDDGLVWYASGDVCRWTEDGALEFLERKDCQVSVRGHRIEPAEVEKAMLGIPGIEQAAVTLREDDLGGSLAGFFCGPAAEEDTRSALAAALPGYMLPSALHRLDTLPLNVNGKIDRAALTDLPPGPAPSGTPAEVPAAEDGSEAATLRVVAQVWAGLFGREPSVEENFFEIGGHSLLAARVTSRVRQEFGAEVSLGEIFNHPVLGDYAGRVHEIATAASG
ncbi:hypothetical protein N566_04830 [Streptomycetaceae bacterium MP113-05]|nr:hypothetical protein N566_04830 [Streptomycetaceae bacterium MP113-05]